MKQHPPLRIERLRKRIAFERYLARLQATSPDTWLMKGGMALEMRFSERARTTKDLDIATSLGQSEIMEVLQSAAELDLKDHFEFQVELVEANLQDEGERTLRTRLRSYLASQRFEFSAMDVGLENEAQNATTTVQSSDLLEFAGIYPIEVPVLPLEYHLAEKLHACTRFYGDGRPNSRAKDLVDIVLIASEMALQADRSLEAIAETFRSRQTHEIPSRFPEPPEFWQRGYREMATEVGIEADAMAGYRVAASFFDPLLTSDVSGEARWLPKLQHWG